MPKDMIEDARRLAAQIEDFLAREYPQSVTSKTIPNRYFSRVFIWPKGYGSPIEITLLPQRDEDES